jgi:integrase
VRAHDLRAAFVTVSLANGKTETYVTDRTGHTSSQMLYGYKRPARTHGEVNLGEFVPLHEAIPELAEVEL